MSANFEFELESLLDDKFFSLSDKLREIYTKKKAKKEELKKVYENFQTELKELDEEAKSLLEEWSEKSSKE